MSDWHSPSGSVTLGANGLLSRGDWALEVFKRISASVNESSRLPAALRLVRQINARPELMAAPSVDYLRLVSEAERTIWELFVIAFVADLRANRPRTPFTAKMITTALGGSAIAANDKNRKARNTQFELYVAALLSLGGTEVALAEPALRMLYWGEYIGVAIKRMGSTRKDKLKERLLSASDQIGRWTSQGVIAVNIDSFFAGKTLPGAVEKRNQEFGMAMQHVRDVVQEQFGPLKRVRGILTFGHLEAWALGATPPRHDSAYPLSRVLFDEEEDPTIRLRGGEFWDGVMARMDRQLMYLRTGKQ